MPMVKDPRWSAINMDGSPCVGAQIYVFTNGTSEVAQMYSDPTLQTPTTTPIIADSRGIFPPFYAAPGTYTVRVNTPEGSLISETPNVVVD